MDLGAAITVPKEGGGVRADIGEFITGSGAGHPDIQLWYVGGNPPYRENPGGGSTTELQGISKGSNLGNEPMEYGSTPPWRRQYGRRGWRNWKLIFPEVIT